ncbi:hypothetical protein GHK86_02245 [Acidimicrobiaceae bacterium USS-CC1]|uniref:Uncharacterized protein n=1 Tax=Acidiferrimicrobium australe TaxID=2664430 RepID=A0ABW9QQ15_9ACTN|nr:hypothetical protein [Acidiferrimicrobium australe]
MPERESFDVDVDGERFAVRPRPDGGVDYDWLSGPNAGYGFSSGPGIAWGSPPAGEAPELSMDRHRERIRAFLALVDPQTGYIEDR